LLNSDISSETEAMFGLIDPAGPFAPATEWRQFLERMLQLPQDEPQVQEAIREVREALARAEREPAARR
jgi:hypothetical protein